MCVCVCEYVRKRSLKSFFFKAYIALKSWLIVPKRQLSVRQSSLILKVS